MIRILDPSNECILGISLDGTIEAADITRIWNVMEERLKTCEKVRFYVEARDFHLSGLTKAALAEDIRMWLKHPWISTKMERAALVTDTKWLRTLCEVECSLFPGLACETFAFDEKEKAMEWVKSEEPELDEVNIKWVELVEAGILRSLAGIGIGLLAADLVDGKKRKAVGWSLFLGSVAVGVPLSIKVMRKNRGLLCE